MDIARGLDTIQALYGEFVPILEYFPAWRGDLSSMGIGGSFARWAVLPEPTDVPEDIDLWCNGSTYLVDFLEESPGWDLVDDGPCTWSATMVWQGQRIGISGKSLPEFRAWADFTVCAVTIDLALQVVAHPRFLVDCRNRQLIQQGSLTNPGRLVKYLRKGFVPDPDLEVDTQIAGPFMDSSVRRFRDIQDWEMFRNLLKAI